MNYFFSYRMIIGASLCIGLLLTGAGCGGRATTRAIAPAVPYVKGPTTPPPDVASSPQPSAPATTPETPSSPVAQLAAFDTSAKLKKGDSLTYADGLTVTLKAINDSRCPKGVQCIWQGELAPVLTLSGGSLTAPAELQLGTVRGLTKQAGPYSVALSDVTETTAAVTVTKSAATKDETHADKIRVTAPAADATVTSPLTVTGEARGPWYFEASFPVQLLDANGQVLAAVPAQAQGDWMTEAFVPFKAVLTFTTPTTATGTLVLKKDNPSGLPEHDDAITIPVRF